MRGWERFFYIFCVSGFSLSPLALRGYSEARLPLLEQLASPEYEGRGVGTAGLEKAQNLLLESLRAAGYEPQLQSLRVFTGNELGPANRFAQSGTGDFVPLAFSRSGAVNGAAAVFAGFGITLRNAGEAIYDDYEGLDVQGKIVIVLTGDPAVGAPKSIFRDPAYFQYSTPMYKVQNAALHGAAGIVLVRDPLSLTGPEPELKFLSRQGGGAVVEILAGQLKVSAAEAFLGRNLRDWQESVARTQKPASFSAPGKTDLLVDMRRQLGEVKNVMVVLPGTDPLLAKEYIVIGAHYDHLGFGGDSSLDPHGSGQVHAGADDNASGVQGVFDLAVSLKRENLNRRSVAFLFFTAEEIGLLGSQHYAENAQLPEGAKIVAMLNLDMIGRLAKNRLTVIGGKSALEFPGILEAANGAAGFDLLTADDGFGSSDHASFLRLKIPALFFTSGAHEDYHRPTDTAEKINLAGLEQILKFVKHVWRSIDALPASPTYDPAFEDPNQPTRPGRGYGVYFGSIPEFVQGDVKGVLLQGVRAASPAAEAGLIAGDILTGLGEVQIGNLYDLVFALRYYRPGDAVVVTWVRAGVKMQAHAMLRAREG